MMNSRRLWGRRGAANGPSFSFLFLSWGSLGAKVAQKPSPRASRNQFYIMILIRFLTDVGMMFDDFWEDVWKNSARTWDDVFDDFLFILAFVFRSCESVFEKYPREPKSDPGQSQEVPRVHKIQGNPRAGAQ